MRQLWAREAVVYGFSRYFYPERWAFARERMLALCQAGKIRAGHHLVDGFENTPDALGDMLAGKFFGKVLVIPWPGWAARGGRHGNPNGHGRRAQLRLSLGRPVGAPVAMMAHAMGTSLRIWDRQVAALADRYRLLRYDWRGHGGSAAPPGPYSLEQFEDDAVGVMTALELPQVHWIGISTGGMIGQGLAINHPNRIASLCLCNTTSQANQGYRDWVAERQAVSAKAAWRRCGR